ncbi:hypothetical protein B0H10DRAFT_1132085 [Mycena sp. CBHHK59/15]|nr:hypothetical protein B0H10DRAFT_1132085 [Mycena sp. CBHHK59/15]
MNLWTALLLTSLVLTFRPSYGLKLSRRVDENQCNQLCAPMAEAETNVSNTTACTNSFVQQYAQCLDCSDQLNSSDPSEAADSQSTIDTFVSDCTAGGFPVKGATVAGSFKASGGSADSPIPASSGPQSTLADISASTTAASPGSSHPTSSQTKQNGARGPADWRGMDTVFAGVLCAVLLHAG